MRSTKKRAYEKNGKVIAQGKVWNKTKFEEFRKYQTEYNRTHYKLYGLRFNRQTDSEIIEQLNKQDVLMDYIRELILADIRKEKKKK